MTPDKKSGKRKLPRYARNKRLLVLLALLATGLRLLLATARSVARRTAFLLLALATRFGLLLSRFAAVLVTCHVETLLPKLIEAQLPAYAAKGDEPTSWTRQ